MARFVLRFVRPEVIETSTYRWQRYVLPLNYGRIFDCDSDYITS